MFKYRRSEGKIVFRLVPFDNIDDFKTYDSIFIYWSDFAYLRPFIYQVYPQRKENREDGFDDTSWNK